MSAKRDWVWMTRNAESGGNVSLWPHARKPAFIEEYGWWECASLAAENARIDCCYLWFKRITGLTVPTDRALRVRIKCEVIDER